MIFFITSLDVKKICFILFTAFLFLFLGMQTRERARCAHSVFPFTKKEKKITLPFDFFSWF